MPIGRSELRRISARTCCDTVILIIQGPMSRTIGIGFGRACAVLLASGKDIEHVKQRIRDELRRP
jgi:hypothetical protein